MTFTRPLSGIPVNPRTTVYADNPPFPLAAVTFNDTTNDQPALQAQLDYVKATYGGGAVWLSKPNGAGVKITSGITIPAGVQLLSDEVTLVDASAVTSGSAITVNDNNMTPLVGIRMDGGMFSPSSTDLTSSYTGISVTGRGLLIQRCHLQYFGRAFDTAHTNTYGVTVENATVDHCATGLYEDVETSGASNAGEKIVWSGGSIANSVRAFIATGNGTHLRFDNTSLDFCTTDIGRINNAVVEFEGHIETNCSYLFDMTGNSQLFLANSRLVLGTTMVCKPGVGPSNYSFGKFRGSLCQAFFTDGNGASWNVGTEDMVSLPANATTATVSYPWPVKWGVVTAAFCYSDGNSPPNGDTVRVTAGSSSTGAMTLTASASSTQQRWILVRWA